MGEKLQIEFAQAIRWEADKALTAITDGRQSKTTVHPCEELATRGLPVRMGNRTELTTSFPHWKPASFNEYVCAWEVPPLPDASHLAWEFLHGRKRYVVPALVLIRALFRPTKPLLPYLYRLQSLEDLLEFSSEDSATPIASLTYLGQNYFRRDRHQLVRPLSWMYCFPSARLMWASIYHQGRGGAIGLTLPAAQAKVLLKGMIRGHNVYVTSIHLDSVTALEEPFEFALSHPRDISYLVESWAGRRNRNRPKALVALRGDKATLSDAEWDAIEVILENTNPFKRTTAVHPRAMVDAVLEKLCRGTPWKDTSYPAGVTQSAAASAWHRWRVDGRWTQIESVLRASRGELLANGDIRKTP